MMAADSRAPDPRAPPASWVLLSAPCDLAFEELVAFALGRSAMSVLCNRQR
jgi:hypothetical protein